MQLELGNSSFAELAADLRRRLRGAVLVGRRTSYATDFGRTVSRAPRIVVRVAGESDLRHVLELARIHRVPLQVRGSGHSVNGQTLSSGIVVVNAPETAAPVRWLGGDRVEVSGRARWRQVEKALNRAGRSVPVLADYLGLSVGGTLSVGGYGVDSVVHGAQVDQVEQLRLIRPDGNAVWCSQEEASELFRYSLAGLGQVGVIEKAVLRTVPYQGWATMFTYAYDSLEELVDSFAWMVIREDAQPYFFKAVHSRGRFIATYGVVPGTAAAAFSARPPAGLGARPWTRRLVCPRYRMVRSLAVSLWVARFPRCRRLWNDYLLDHEGLVAFTAFLSRLLERDAFSGCLRAVYFLGVRRPPGAASLPFEAAGTGAFKFLVGLYLMVPRRDLETLRRVRAAAGSCLAKAVGLGGRPYLYGWHPLDQKTVRHLYGSAYNRLLELRRELDPDGIFQPGKLPIVLPEERELS